MSRVIFAYFFTSLVTFFLPPDATCLGLCELGEINVLYGCSLWKRFLREGCSCCPCSKRELNSNVSKYSGACNAKTMRLTVSTQVSRNAIKTTAIANSIKPTCLSCRTDIPLSTTHQTIINIQRGTHPIERH